MNPTFKDSAEQKAINQEIDLFVKHLKNTQVKEVNFDHNSVIYRAASYLVTVKFGLKKWTKSTTQTNAIAG